jgi:methylphosphotriester-DNA--protein-cysteine methyltransferase
MAELTVLAAAGLTALLVAAVMAGLRAGARPRPDDADPAVVRRRAEDGMVAALAQLASARAAWAEAAAVQHGRHRGGDCA